MLYVPEFVDDASVAGLVEMVAPGDVKVAPVVRFFVPAMAAGQAGEKEQEPSPLHAPPVWHR
jgi:hypothetical protein